MPYNPRPAHFLSFLCLVWALGALPAYSQSPTGKKWGLTELDSVVSVRTPFRGEPSYDEAVPYFSLFTAAGHTNRFVMMRWDMAGMARYNPDKAKGGKLVMDMDKLLRRLIGANALQFTKAKFKREYTINLPTAPDGVAMHRFYSGNDDVLQGPAALEVTWFTKNEVIYLFFCTTIDTESQAASEERQQYFSTINVIH